jgi:hypothetical protein
VKPQGIYLERESLNVGHGAMAQADGRGARVLGTFPHMLERDHLGMHTPQDAWQI